MVLVLVGCNRQDKDVMVFKTDDNKMEMGVYKRTILLMGDVDDQRVGARGYLKMDGKTDITYLGFTCGSEGGQYSQLSVDREDLDGYVSFDSGSWDASSGWVMDVLAKEVCKTAIEDEAKSHKPEKHTRFLGR